MKFICVLKTFFKNVRALIFCCNSSCGKNKEEKKKSLKQTTASASATAKADVILDLLETEFNNMKWIKNKRNNVSEVPCFSMTFGEVMRPYHGRSQSAANKKFPKVYFLLQQLSIMYKLEHSSYTINKNLECLPHRDKNNVGDSVIVSLGKFKGGRLIVEGKYFDICRKPFKFNGAKQTHRTEPFEGNRYTIVFYNIKCAKKNFFDIEKKKLI
jgi:hypothetical protein